MSCLKCSTGSQECSLCGVRFCNTQCWERSTHGVVCESMPIGTPEELKEEHIQRGFITKENFLQAVTGIDSSVCFVADNVQYWLLGERHTPKKQIIPNKLDLELVDDKLIFTGNDERVMSAPRFLYALAAASKQQNTNIDMFLELDYIPQSLLHPKTPWKGGDSTLDMNIIARLFEHMKCTSLVREEKKQCDVYPNCRFHIADYRTKHWINQIDDTTLLDVVDAAYYVIRSSIMNATVDVEIEMWLDGAEALSTFTSELGDDWIKREFYIALNSDNFLNDRVAFYSDAFTNFKKRIGRLPKMKPVLNLFALLENRAVSTGKHTYHRAYVHEVRKQFLKLQIEDPTMAGKVRAYVDTYYEFTKIPLTNFANDLHHAFISAGAVYMDIPLICRMMRNFGHAPSSIKIAYTGAAHARNIYKFFVFALPLSIQIFSNMRASDERILYDENDDSVFTLEPYLRSFASRFINL